MPHKSLANSKYIGAYF